MLVAVLASHIHPKPPPDVDPTPVNDSDPDTISTMPLYKRFGTISGSVPVPAKSDDEAPVNALKGWSGKP